MKRNVFLTKRTVVKMRTWVSVEPTSKAKRQSRLRSDVFSKIYVSDQLAEQLNSGKINCKTVCLPSPDFKHTMSDLPSSF